MKLLSWKVVLIFIPATSNIQKDPFHYTFISWDSHIITHLCSTCRWANYHVFTVSLLGYLILVKLFILQNVHHPIACALSIHIVCPLSIENLERFFELICISSFNSWAIIFVLVNISLKWLLVLLLYLFDV